jgi:hypothetical protein
MKFISVLLAILLAGGAAHDTLEGHGAHARLGKVHFPVACNAAAQHEFDLAMAYYHSFAWVQTREPLERVLQADPGCGMAHWARVLASLDNPFAWPSVISPSRSCVRPRRPPYRRKRPRCKSGHCGNNDRIWNASCRRSGELVPKDFDNWPGTGH